LKCLRGERYKNSYIFLATKLKIKAQHTKTQTRKTDNDTTKNKIRKTTQQQ